MSGFWKGALGYVAHRGNPDFLVPPEWQPPSRTREGHGVGVHLHLDGRDKMHLDLWVNAGESLEAEVERLISMVRRGSTGTTRNAPSTSYWPIPTATCSVCARHRMGV